MLAPNKLGVVKIHVAKKEIRSREENTETHPHQKYIHIIQKDWVPPGAVLEKKGVTLSTMRTAALAAVCFAQELTLAEGWLGGNVVVTLMEGRNLPLLDG